MMLKHSTIVTFLLYIAAILVAIHTGILIIYYQINNPEIFDFVRMFDLDMERNIPTLFSSLLLALGSLLFYLLSLIDNDKKEKNYWRGLSLVFIFLSFDESAKIHEQIGDYVEKYVHLDGYFYYPWVLVYGFGIILLAMIYMKFFWSMPRKVFWSFMAAATLYLTGAIVFDMIGGNEASQHGTTTILYSIYYTIEESLEMLGSIYLISILLKLLEHKSITFTR